MREKVLECVDKVKRYLTLPQVSFDVVGVNVFGDTSKRFDIEAEEIIMKCFEGFLNDFIFIGEEGGVRVFGKPKWVVVVDPVDGSTNFSYDIPWASVSIALAPYTSNTKVKDIVFAVVSEVFRDRVYIFDEGNVDIGTLRRRQSPAPIVLGYFEQPESYKPLINYTMLSPRKLTIRSLGSAALDIIYVGLGNAEIFIDVRAKLRNLDIASALKIATALGAKALDCSEGLDNAENIPIDTPVNIKCIAVAYDEEILHKFKKALEQH